MSNLELWNKVKQPPPEALKEITGGRLKGMTDISPQWRYQILTEQFGQCGVGWTYEIKKLWYESYGDEVTANAEILLFIGDNKPIPGIGGSKISTKESKGVHVSDEAYKMAVTDAISVACKVLGIGANIYMGKKDDSKYGKPSTATKPSPSTKPVPNAKQGPDGGDSKLRADATAMIQAMTKSDPSKMAALVNKHSGFDGKNGRVEKDSLEELKDKWLFRTFKNIEGEYDLWQDTQDNVNDDMSITDDEPPLPAEAPSEVPFQ